MGHHHHHRHGSDDGDSSLAELLDLDGEVLTDYWADALDWVRQAADGGPRQRIVDLGAGTGTGTLRLADRFAEAEVVAVDSSPDMLDRIRAKALAQGLAGRVRTVQADLDQPWPDLGTVDVTWASLSLHHLTGPDRVLRDLHAATRPGGLVAVTEFDGRPRFLTDAVGDGFEERLLGLLHEHDAERLPELGTDWPARLTAAGFTLVDVRPFVIDLAPAPPSTGRYADLWLRRLGERLSDQLTPADAATLAGLLDPDGPSSLLRRDDLHVRGTRTVTLAHRP
ncbi:class I SAM-dependent methyltransferase [Jiangella mangrovi]|uniref:SAM-dependent methyltransferase n=1 Tax=Jiangella mangrovi TaxID=1524084 RepID=A0A7W9GM14_9ACTN|nr:class I SAM-dependent methyltransferase [Jiangella mangrovi]MBB5786334.1 SAM-dependent methyltransferase [Jiangella mangrovi]